MANIDEDTITQQEASWQRLQVLLTISEIGCMIEALEDVRKKGYGLITFDVRNHRVYEIAVKTTSRPE